MSDSDDEKAGLLSYRAQDDGTDTDEAPLKDIDTVLDEIGFGSFHIRLFALCSVGSLCDALEVSILSVLAAVWKEYWSLDSTDVALISSMSYVGMMIGASVGGFLCDKYGRRVVFLWSLLGGGLSGFISALMTSYPVFVVFRFLVGLSYGSNLMADLNMYMEFLPKRSRGFYFVLFEVLWAVYLCLGVGLCWWLQPSYGWRYPVAIYAIPAILVVWLRSKIPESPRYLLANGERDEAEAVLHHIARENSDQNEDNEYLRHRRETRFRLAEFEVLQEDPRYSMLTDPAFKQIFPLMLIWGLYNLSSSVTYWLPYIFSVTGDSETEREDYNYGIALTAVACKLLVVSAMLPLISRVPRLMFLRVGFFAAAGTFICMGLTYGHIGGFLFFAVLFLIFTSSTVTTLYTYTPEVFPTNIRATCLGICQLCYRAGHVIGPLMIAWLDDDYSFVTMTLIMSLFYILAGFVSVYLLDKETKGVAIEEHNKEMEVVMSEA